MRSSLLKIWLLVCLVSFYGCGGGTDDEKAKSGNKPQAYVGQTPTDEELVGHWEQETQEPVGQVSLVLNADGSGSWTVGSDETAFSYDPRAIDFSPEPVQIPAEAADGPGLRVYQPEARIPATFLNHEETEYHSEAALFIRFLDADRIEVVARGPQPVGVEPLPVWRLVTKPVILRRKP